MNGTTQNTKRRCLLFAWDNPRRAYFGVSGNTTAKWRRKLHVEYQTKASSVGTRVLELVCIYLLPIQSQRTNAVIRRMLITSIAFVIVANAAEVVQGIL